MSDYFCPICTAVVADCYHCGKATCECKCFRCGRVDETCISVCEHGDLIHGHTIQWDSLPMKSQQMEDKHIREGWIHESVDDQHFMIRPTCRECLNKETEVREVWAQIDKERKRADYNPIKDNYMAVLVGAEGDTSADESDYWTNFTD